MDYYGNLKLLENCNKVYAILFGIFCAPGGRLNKDYLNSPLLEEPGSELDMLMARHMGCQAIESGGLPWLLDGNKAYAVPQFSTDHNAFFDRVVVFMREKFFRVDIKDRGRGFVVTCTHSKHGELAQVEGASLPHAGCLSAITAIRELEKKVATNKLKAKSAKQIGPRG